MRNFLRLSISCNASFCSQLTFLKIPGFYRARKALAENPISAFGEFDAILLTQHLPDHAHPPTLERLPRTLPVVAPTDALPLLRRLGYKTIIELSPNQTVVPLPTTFPSLTLSAGPGSIVGPPWSRPQLAYFWEFATSARSGPAPADDGTAAERAPREGASPTPKRLEGPITSSEPVLRVYFEPHGTHDEKFMQTITANGRVAPDAVIGPVRASSIPLFLNYALVNGLPELLQACRALKPRACLAFDNTKTEASGWLSKIIDQSGPSFDELRVALQSDPELRSIDLRLPKIMDAVVLATADQPAVPKAAPGVSS
jgi:hypothetical protein